jgi:hypothetical protein
MGPRTRSRLGPSSPSRRSISTPGSKGPTRPRAGTRSQRMRRGRDLGCRLGHAVGEKERPSGAECPLGQHRTQGLPTDQNDAQRGRRRRTRVEQTAQHRRHQRDMGHSETLQVLGNSLRIESFVQDQAPPASAQRWMIARPPIWLRRRQQSQTSSDPKPRRRLTAAAEARGSCGSTSRPWGRRCCRWSSRAGPAPNPKGTREWRSPSRFVRPIGIRVADSGDQRHSAPLDAASSRSSLGSRPVRYGSNAAPTA